MVLVALGMQLDTASMGSDDILTDKQKTALLRPSWDTRSDQSEPPCCAVWARGGTPKIAERSLITFTETA
jgi:hypothetical protein